MSTHPPFAIASVLAFALAALAHPPDQDGNHSLDTPSIRNWTNARTGESVRGSFLAARGGPDGALVSIERSPGDVVVFALADLDPDGRTEAQLRIAHVTAINEIQTSQDPVAKKSTPKPAQAASFDLFAPFVKTRWDDQYLFIESDGLPHAPVTYPLMVGIKSWQQQVPLPQAYTGNNAWRIPLNPQLADKPVSGKTQLYRGAIALAANGVPIFNALNNRGDDALKAGELDEFGGHCGRADDYHYHIAPLVLQKTIGKDKPLAYALDGFPIYGLFDPAAKAAERSCPLSGAEKLDELNGHFALNADGSKGLYHYHASTTYPYINGGMRGKVTVKEDQVDPQPRANPVRESGRPLRGATITDFKTLGEKSWSLEYTLAGARHYWNFRAEDGGKYTFDFIDPDGTKKTETYSARTGRDRPPRGDNSDRPRRGNGRPRDPNTQPPRRDEPAPAAQPIEKPSNDPKAPASDFSLTSSAISADGKLPAEFACDGASISPPLSWAKPPQGTKSFAVTMHHIPGPPRPGDKPGEDKHVYIVLYNIPADTVSLEKGQTVIGTRGINTVNRRAEYAPPCSQGPGDKKYTLTVYALSADPLITPASRNGATMDELLAAIKDTTLATATLDVTYARP